jgi:integrase
MQDSTLASATADKINQHMTDLLSGANSHIKDEGFSKSTVSLYQAALRSFYRYHDDLEVRPEDITIVQPDESPVNPDDLFTEDEVQAMREACTNPRDRCLIELLLNTGQRVRAIQTLRIKDIDVENGSFQLNPDVDGLKHAEGSRPLLGARAAVREWLEYHPNPEQDNYLITGLHSYNRDSGDMLSRPQIRRRLMAIGDKAGVEKPVNPHQWRHYAVTMMYKHYDLSLDQIRWMIGHGEDSRILETTYRHLTDEDRIQAVEEEAGFRDPEEETSPFTPPACPTCDEPLADNAKACPRCGEVFTPDAKASQEKIDDLALRGMREAKDTGEANAVENFRQFLKDNPEKAVDILQDEL